MPDLDELIGDAVVEAGLAERDDMGEFTETVEETPTPELEETSAPGAEEEAPAAEATEEEAGKEGAGKKTPDAEGDELDKELQSLGIQPKDARGGESRIRYTRVRKIWDNWKNRLTSELTEKHGKAVKELEARATANAERLTYMDNVEKLINTDPRRYIDLLVMAQPAFRQYLNPTLFGGGGAAPDGSGGGTAAPVGDKMPGPDAQFADGSTGYSPEGLQKVLEWNTARTLKAAEDMFNKRYGKPLENLTTQQRTAAERQMHETRVRNNVAQAKRIYGQAFTDDFGDLGSVKADSAIIKVLNENKGINFLDACAIALIPRIQADRNKIREDVIRELKERPAGARRSAPEGSRASAVPSAGSTEEIIAGEMRKAGML